MIMIDETAPMLEHPMFRESFIVGLREGRKKRQAFLCAFQQPKFLDENGLGATGRFRVLDHEMIFLMIAGTYTPMMLLGLGGATWGGRDGARVRMNNQPAEPATAHARRAETMIRRRTFTSPPPRRRIPESS